MAAQRLSHLHFYRRGFWDSLELNELLNPLLQLCTQFE